RYHRRACGDGDPDAAAADAGVHRNRPRPRLVQSVARPLHPGQRIHHPGHRGYRTPCGGPAAGHGGREDRGSQPQRKAPPRLRRGVSHLRSGRRAAPHKNPGDGPAQHAGDRSHPEPGADRPAARRRLRHQRGPWHRSGPEGPGGGPEQRKAGRRRPGRDGPGASAPGRSSVGRPEHHSHPPRLRQHDPGLHLRRK
ncbi:Hydrolase, partial [Dysosmobacter welbionis]